MKRVFLAFLFAVVGLLASRTAEASHFRFGTINWKVPDPINAPLTVQFTVQHGWAAASPDSTTLNFGDGANNGFIQGPLIGTGTDASGLAYNLYEYTATHTYAAPGTYTAFFESCCRIAGLVNGDQANFRVEAVVNVGSGETGGPVSLAPAIIQMQLGGIRTYQIPSFDPDLDVVSCRFATPAETGLPAGSEIPSVPNGGAQPTLSGACLVTWDLTLAVVNQKYVLHIVMESSHGGGAVSTTAIDLLVEITNVAPPTCTGSGTFVAPVGMLFTTPVLGTDPALGNLTVTMQNAPAASTLMPPSGTTGPSPLAATFSWTPAAGDIGTTIVLVNYKTAQNITGTCSLTIQVPQCVGFGQACVAAGAQGECVNGTTVCAGPGVTTCAPGAPAPETCDTLDNDCDGVVDNNTVESGIGCLSGLPGVCSAGMTACVAGNVNCVATIMPGQQVEACNDQDDDCDGAVDNGFQVGQMCSVGVGQCAATGLFACNGMGGQMCTAIPGEPLPETCDAQDNDCDGVVDNNPAGVGVVCPTGLDGVCATGMTTCSAAGAIECTPDIQPGANTETCNLLDDDCDGSADEDFPTVGMPCTVGVGACEATGTFICDPLGGGAICDATPGEPAATETCGDDIDADCDGSHSNGCDTDGDGLLDDVETGIGTDPNDADSDDDGVVDGNEPDLEADTDGDGLVNALDPDSDGDGLKDGTELGLDCSNTATDGGAGNCTPDGDGGATTTDPLNPDSDDDGVDDGDEDVNTNGVVDKGEIDPDDADTDDDGAVDGSEPSFNQDTDGDGLINALDPDSDGDGLKDGTELGFGCSDPATNSSAGNCTPDADGGATKTDPLDTDTDDGSVSDGDEDTNKNGVVDEGERDPNNAADDVPDTGGYFGEGSGFCAVQQPGNQNSSSTVAWLFGLVALARVISRRRKAA